MLDFVSLDDVVPLVLLIALLGFVGSQASGKPESLWSARVGLIAFLAFTAAGWSEWKPENPAEFVTLAMRALLAAGLVATVTMVVLPVFTFAWRGVAAMFPKVEPKPAPTPKEKPPDVQTVDLPPTPPPPSPEEKAAAAKKKYEQRVAMLDAAKLEPMERHAAGEKAKQDYLRELDEAMR